MAGGNTIGSAALYLSADDTRFQKGLSDAEKRFDQHRKHMQAEAQATSEAISKSWKFVMAPLAIGSGLAGLAGGLSLSGLVTESVKLSAEFEATKASFGAMLGDFDKGAKLFKDIRDFAATTPLGTKELSNSAQALLGVGVSADQVIPSLRVLGDLAKGDGNELAKLAVIYGQVRGKGKLMADDMRQFLEARVNPKETLAAQLGVAKTEIDELASAGRIQFRDLQRAFDAMTSKGGLFFEQMASRSKTTLGLFANLKDNWQSLLATVGDIVIDEFGLKSLMRDLAGLMADAEGNADRMRPAIHSLAEVTKEMFRAGTEFSLNLLVVVGQLTDAVKDLADGKNWASRQMGSGWLDDMFPGIRWAAVASSGQEVTETGKDSFAKMAIDIREKVEKALRGLDLSMSGDSLRNMVPLVGDLANVAKGLTSKFKIDPPTMNADQTKFVRELREAMDPTLKVKRELEDIDRIAALGGFIKGGFDSILSGDAKRMIDFAKGRVMGDDPEAKKLKPFDFRGKDVAIAARGSAEAASTIINMKNYGRGFEMGDKQAAAMARQEKLLDEANKLQRELNDLLGRVQTMVVM